MIRPKNAKEELGERISALEIVVLLLLNTLRRKKEIEIAGIKHIVLPSISDKDLDMFEKLITRPEKNKKLD